MGVCESRHLVDVRAIVAEAFVDDLFSAVLAVALMKCGEERAFNGHPEGDTIAGFVAKLGRVSAVPGIAADERGCVDAVVGRGHDLNTNPQDQDVAEHAGVQTGMVSSLPEPGLCKAPGDVSTLHHVGGSGSSAGCCGLVDDVCA